MQLAAQLGVGADRLVAGVLQVHLDQGLVTVPGDQRLRGGLPRQQHGTGERENPERARRSAAH